jgi:hypothetical protein
MPVNVEENTGIMCAQIPIWHDHMDQGTDMPGDDIKTERRLPKARCDPYIRIYLRPLLHDPWHHKPE